MLRGILRENQEFRERILRGKGLMRMESIGRKYSSSLSMIIIRNTKTWFEKHSLSYCTYKNMQQNRPSNG